MHNITSFWELIRLEASNEVSITLEMKWKSFFKDIIANIQDYIKMYKVHGLKVCETYDLAREGKMHRLFSM